MSGNNNLVIQSELRIELDFECTVCGSTTHALFGGEGEQTCSNCQKSYSSSELETILDNQLRDRIDSITMYKNEAQSIESQFQNDEIDKNEYNDKLKELYVEEYQLEKAQTQYQNGSISRQEFVNTVEELDKHEEKVKQIKELCDSQNFKLYDTNSILGDVTEDRDNGVIDVNQEYNKIVSELYENENADTSIHSVTNKNSPSIRVREGSKILLMWATGTFSVTGVTSKQEAYEYAEKVMEFIDGEIVDDSFDKVMSNSGIQLPHKINLDQFLQVVYNSPVLEKKMYNKESWGALEIIYAGNNNVKIFSSGKIEINSTDKKPEEISEKIREIIEKNHTEIKNDYYKFSQNERYEPKSTLSNNEIEFLKEHSQEIQVE